MEKEIQTIMRNSGYQIPPHRMASMSKTINKIVELVTCNPAIGYTAREAHFMLQFAETMISSAEENRWN